jgi:serine/threonine protein kinase
MSPEALEASVAQPSFDLWALSVILFEAIAGRRPFRGRDFPEVKAAILSGQVPDVRTFRPEAGDRLSRFLAQSLSRDPAGRPGDARAWQHDLSALRIAST